MHIYTRQDQAAYKREISGMSDALDWKDNRVTELKVANIQIVDI